MDVILTEPGGSGQDPGKWGGLNFATQASPSPTSE